VGRSRSINVSRRRAVVVRLRRPLAAGRYAVRARGRDSARRIVAAKRRIVLH
jgi:hypothetical protein